MQLKAAWWHRFVVVATLLATLSPVRAPDVTSPARVRRFRRTNRRSRHAYVTPRRYDGRRWMRRAVRVMRWKAQVRCWGVSSGVASENRILPRRVGNARFVLIPDVGYAPPVPPPSLPRSASFVCPLSHHDAISNQQMWVNLGSGASPVLLDTVLVRLLRTDGGFHAVGCILQMFNDLSSRTELIKKAVRRAQVDATSRTRDALESTRTLFASGLRGAAASLENASSSPEGGHEREALESTRASGLRGAVASENANSSPAGRQRSSRSDSRRGVCTARAPPPSLPLLPLSSVRCLTTTRCPADRCG
jgi:hypothetical protein